MVEDMVFGILLWLPVTALLRFKAVCKSWRSLIESSAFISQHLHHHHHRHLDDQEDSWNLIAFDPSQAGFSLLSGNNFQFSRNLELQTELGFLPKIIATCDGIVCLHHGVFPDILLWNPATRQFTTLPKAPKPLPHNPDRESFNYGFGFDVKSNDYKVVQILIEADDGPLFLDGPLPYSKPNTITNVYSLSTSSWRTVDVVLPVDAISYNPKFPLRSGIYCWLGSAPVNGDWPMNNLIFYFDFTTEVFGTIPVPDVCVNNESWLILGLSNQNITCTEICVCDSGDGFCQVWVLNQYDANHSWTKLYAIPIEEGSCYFGMSKNGKIFWNKACYSGQSMVYLSDPVTLEKSILPVEEPSYCFQAAVYKESLVSVKGPIDATAICADFSEKCQSSA